MKRTAYGLGVVLACVAAAQGQQRMDRNVGYRQNGATSDPAQMVLFMMTGSTLGSKSPTLNGTTGNAGGANTGDAAGSTVSVDTLQIPETALKEMHEFQKKFDEGKIDEAARHAEKALKIFPQWAAAHQDLGQSYARMRQYDKAFAEFHNAASLDAKMVAPWVSMAGAYFLQGQYHEGENAARRALELDPANGPATYFLGRTLVAQEHELTNAMELLRKSQEQFPAAHLVLANVYLKQNQTDEAVGELRSYLGQANAPAKEKVACMVDHLTKPAETLTCSMQ
jgi:tetratricopeptide (TPR) repeat protein